MPQLSWSCRRDDMYLFLPNVQAMLHSKTKIWGPITSIPCVKSSRSTLRLSTCWGCSQWWQGSWLRVSRPIALVQSSTERSKCRPYEARLPENFTLNQNNMRNEVWFQFCHLMNHPSYAFSRHSIFLYYYTFAYFLYCYIHTRKSP